MLVFRRRVGKDGHAVIATPQSMLSPAAEQGVNLLLNGESMASVSSWADEITHEDEWRWTTPLHFTNVRIPCYKGKGEGYSNCTLTLLETVDLDGANPGFATQGQLYLPGTRGWGFSRVVWKYHSGCPQVCDTLCR